MSGITCRVLIGISLVVLLASGCAAGSRSYGGCYDPSQNSGTAFKALASPPRLELQARNRLSSASGRFSCRKRRGCRQARVALDRERRMGELLSVAPGRDDALLSQDQPRLLGPIERRSSVSVTSSVKSPVIARHKSCDRFERWTGWFNADLLVSPVPGSNVPAGESLGSPTCEAAFAANRGASCGTLAPLGARCRQVGLG